LDIYPNANGDLDRNAYTGFCRATTCTVSIAYDQSGNGNNFTQTTAASQPAWNISLSTLGNRPAMTIGDISAIAMTAPHTSTIDDLWVAGGYATAVVAVTGNAGGANRILYKANGGAGPSLGWDWRVNSGGTTQLFKDGATTTDGSWTTTAGVTFAGHIYDVQYSSASLSNAASIGVDGNTMAQSAPTQPVGTVSTDAANNLLLGNNAATAGIRGFTGSIAETILWKTTPTVFQLEAIRRNQAAYYGVAAVN